MNMTTLRKATSLLAQRDAIDRRLTKILINSNGGRPKSRRLKQHGNYLVAVKKLSKSKRVAMGKIYRERGVKAAVAAAQKMVAR